MESSRGHGRMGVGGYMAGPGASTRLLRRRLIVTRLARTATPDPGQLHHVRECCMDCQHALLPPLRRSRRSGPRDRRLFVGGEGAKTSSAAPTTTTATSSETHTPAPGAVEVSPGGVTTAVGADAESTED